MPRQTAQLEVNNFTRGLITEAGPLTFPDNASLFEKNFELNKDGSRSRRLGMDYEVSHQVHTEPSISVTADGDVAFQTFVWGNVAGDPDTEFVVVQIGNILRVFDNTQETISAFPISHFDGTSTVDSIDVGVIDTTTRFGIAAVDGNLVVATGAKEITVVEYNGTTTTSFTDRLKVRGVFGVEDNISVSFTIPASTENMYDPDFVGYRPSVATTTDQHLYNVTNQSWGVPRELDAGGVSSTLANFITEALVYPSNADTIHIGMDFNTDTPPKRVFYPERVRDEPNFRIEAPRGYFVIDALERGKAREEAYDKNLFVFGTVTHPALPSGSLPLDITPTGATAIGEYAGRLFYSGFSGEVVEGDNRSPDLSSYVLFSQVVEQAEQIGQCYQVGDPTSDDLKDLVATDGGFIKIQGAYGIKALKSIGNGLVVLAENGVWMVRGDSGIGFSATAHEVIKLSSQGCIAAGSAVTVNDTLFYWADSGIFRVAPNEVGDYVASNLTSSTIQTEYVTISNKAKRRVNGGYDAYSQRIRWLYNNDLIMLNNTEELVLDLILGSFYKSEIQKFDTDTPPMAVAPFAAPPYVLGTSSDSVQVNGVIVQAASVDVAVSSSIRVDSLREIKYLAITDGAPDTQGISFTFSQYKDTSFRDWKTYNSVGLDAEAQVITGYVTGGDSSRYKQAPMLISHLRRTEESFDTVDGQIVPLNQSSCIVQAQWDWADSVNSNRWGREFQAYQYNKHWIPVDASSEFDTGFSTVVTRRKLRGKGRALSLLFKSEPDKDLVLIGWNLQFITHGRA